MAFTKKDYLNSLQRALEDDRAAQLSREEYLDSLGEFYSMLEDAIEAAEDQLEEQNGAADDLAEMIHLGDARTSTDAAEEGFWDSGDGGSDEDLYLDDYDDFEDEDDEEDDEEIELDLDLN